MRPTSWHSVNFEHRPLPNFAHTTLVTVSKDGKRPDPEAGEDRNEGEPVAFHPVTKAALRHAKLRNRAERLSVARRVSGRGSAAPQEHATGRVEQPVGFRQDDISATGTEIPLDEIKSVA